MDNRCFICGAKNNSDGSCTNKDCPRYKDNSSKKTSDKP